jgi:dihydroflavonol-4-reductase
MKERVFVTGPDGLLDSNLVRELSDRGYMVTVMIEPGKESPTLNALQVIRVECDLLDQDRLIEVSRGMDYIIHVAALTSVWPSKDEIYHKINVTGTQNVIQAALQNRVKRMIYVGSASSFGFGTKKNPGTEDTPYKSAKYGLDYIDSKREAQIQVLKAVKEKGLPALVVNPTFMIGPYDSKPSSVAMIIAVARGKMPGFSAGGKNWAATKDIAVGTCNALIHGRIGECYIMGGANLTYKEAITIIAQSLGVKPPLLSIPNGLTRLTGSIMSAISGLTGNPPKLSFAMSRVACDGHYFSSEKAILELNLPQTNLKEAVAEARAWFIEHKYL